jgi:hypothetical protein
VLRKILGPKWRIIYRGAEEDIGAEKGGLCIGVLRKILGPRREDFVSGC